MRPELSEDIGLCEYSPAPSPAPAYYSNRFAAEADSMELSLQLRTDLLDGDAWGEILSTFSETVRVGVALTDAQGQLLGGCQNRQPAWSLVHDSRSDWNTGCPFCLSTHQPCTAIQDALRTGLPVVVRDQAGFSHVAVPLSLGKHHLGAILAGQVFDLYPDSLALMRVAKELGISMPKLWDLARKERPVSKAILMAAGNLLAALGKAFVRQRYSGILEAQLAETNRYFRLMVESVSDHSLFTVDLEGYVTSWNRGAERMLGYTEVEIIGNNFSCTFIPEDIRLGVPEEQMNKARLTSRARDQGWRVRANGERFWADVNKTALRDDAGRVRGFAVIMQDVTEQKKIATALNDARQAREQLQERFLSHVSHELRTPLTAIYFFTTNVADGLFGDLSPEQHEQLVLALDNLEQLKGMVSDLLDISRVDAHKLTIEPKPVSPAKLIADALNTCRTSADEKKITLTSNVTSSLPFVWADPSRIRQILTNLIDNGIKFTPEGGAITVSIRSSPDDESLLCLSVSDTGCGIGPKNLELVFERLTQIEVNPKAARSGLGLGLFIAKELVLEHGGRIWVESQLGQGSSFFFTLPVFSLAKLCAPILNAANLNSGFVTLITIDAVAPHAIEQGEQRLEIQKVLQHCIRPGHDMVLPLDGDEGSPHRYFIIACSDISDSFVITSCVERELTKISPASKLKTVISSRTLSVPEGMCEPDKIAFIVTEVEHLVQDHRMTTETLQ